MVEIGAGGGSCAKVNEMNQIAVGPESAGSQPGPVCYSRGGRVPAVTDADLILGRIDAHNFAGGSIILAVVVTLVSWSDPPTVEPVVMSAAAFHGEPWRLVSSMLPHGSLFHLAFNLYWVWLFGTLLEERLGSVAAAGIVALTAAGSAAAEYALFYGGIGLSGVVYGLFGLLQVLKTRDPRFLGVLDQGTVNLLVAWFFIAPPQGGFLFANKKQPRARMFFQ